MLGALFWKLVGFGAAAHEDTSQSRCGEGGGGAGLPSVQGSSISLAHPAAHRSPSPPILLSPFALPLAPFLSEGKGRGQDTGSHSVPSVQGEAWCWGAGGSGDGPSSRRASCACCFSVTRGQGLAAASAPGTDRCDSAVVIPTSLLWGTPGPSARAAGECATSQLPLMPSVQGRAVQGKVYCSVAQWCLTLCGPMDCSTPGFHVFLYLFESLKFMSIESVMPSNHLILCCPLLLLPSIFPSIRVFSSESPLHIRWPKYWSFSFSISPSSEYSGVTSFKGKVRVPFTFHFHALDKKMATHSSVLAWRIPGMGEPGGLPSMGSHRVGHD